MRRNWNKVTLKEIAEINPDTIDKAFKHSEIEYIDISSVGTGSLLNTQVLGLNDAPSRAKRLVEDRDTILSTVRPNRRSFCLLKKPKPNVVVSTGFAVLRAKQGTSKRFLYYLINDPKFTNYLTSYAKGAAYPAVDTEIIERAEFTIPEEPEQEKIASILSNYDSLIEDNVRRIQLLEQTAKLIYDEWFAKFKFPGHEKLSKVHSYVGEIPEGWQPKVFGDIAQQIRENVHADEVNPETPYVGLEHIPRKSIALSEWGYAREVESSKLIFRKGDILFGKIRPYFHKVAVAPTNGICSSDTIVIRPVSPEYYSMVLLCASSEKFVGYAAQTSQGTKMPRANWDVLSKYPIIVPPTPVISQFNEIGKDIVSLILNLVHTNRTLVVIRDLLLPKLISGQLDVSKLYIKDSEVEM